MSQRVGDFQVAARALAIHSPHGPDGHSTPDELSLRFNSIGRRNHKIGYSITGQGRALSSGRLHFLPVVGGYVCLPKTSSAGFAVEKRIGS